jgi:hypothetical protein
MRGSRLIAYEQTPFVETYTCWDTVRHFFHVAQLPIRLENQSLRGVHAASESDPAPRWARNARFAKFDISRHRAPNHRWIGLIHHACIGVCQLKGKWDLYEHIQAILTNLTHGKRNTI